MERERIPCRTGSGQFVVTKRLPLLGATTVSDVWQAPLNNWLLFIHGHTQRGSSFLPQTRKILKILCRSSKISHAKSKHTQLASLFLFLKPGSTHVSPLQQTRGSSSVLSHASIIKLLYLTWWLLWFHLPLQSHFLLSSVFLNGIKSHYILNSLYALCIRLILKFGAENGG